MKKIDINNYSANISLVKLSFEYKVKPTLAPRILNSNDSYMIFKSLWEKKGDIEYVESFQVLLLNRRNKVHGTFELSKGSMHATLADINVIAQAVVLSKSSNLIVCHNHPSLDLEPSEADVKLTRNIKESIL